MKALWIRVDANKAAAEEICAIADLLDMPPVHVLGHCVALGGEIAHRIEDGVISEISNSTLERWAQWTGKRGAFAAAVREHMQNDQGQFDDWSDSMGKLVERRKRDRTRKTVSDRPDNSAEPPPKIDPFPRKDDGKEDEIHGNSVALRARARTGRNATVRDVTDSDLSSGANSAQWENAAASAPPARALDPSELPREAIALVCRFYPRGSDPKRRREVVDQLIATLGDGARYKGASVRAQNPGRLAAKCRDVLREGVRDPNAAIVVLLAKLADSSDYTEEQRQLEHVERETEQRAQLHDVLAAEQWLIERPDISTSIDEQLEREGLPAVQLADDDDAGFTAVARRMMRTQLLVSHWWCSQPSTPSDTSNTQKTGTGAG